MPSYFADRFLLTFEPPFWRPPGQDVIVLKPRLLFALRWIFQYNTRRLTYSYSTNDEETYES